MTVYDKLYLTFYFLIITIVQCYWQKTLFKRNLPISHAWHAVYYCLTILPMMYFFRAWWWQVAVIGVLERLAVFDVCLNLIRGKPLFYNGAGTTGSWLDKLENSLSVTWMRVLKVGYVLVFIIVLILI
jgi:hypothetical protein